MGGDLDFGWLGEASDAIARGAATTIGMILVSAVVGIVLSVIGAAGRRSRHVPIRYFVTGYVELIRNTPFIVQMFFIFFGLPSIGLVLNPLVVAILAITINLTAYGIEIVGAGLDAVPPGQTEAGMALGLRPGQIFVKVVLPQALRVISPALTSQIIIMMLESAAVSQIAVKELTYEADLIQARTFLPFETYLVVALIYLGLSIILRRVLLNGGQRFLFRGAA
ncbi:polar amino acid ABC transporter permease [Labrys miyagiensis]|uniref:Polar amino acid ABC transporter permease n=1 Tax=Labrys miyagiensis TaxID=346912 RepID=A0ABQ6CN43_9HYPH|nr:amino acid ABC transporter permease [Labrys miyagiensis]GLS21768.1 polar amino acid ABC transporter permease [Labrys miyagiensis]